MPRAAAATTKPSKIESFAMTATLILSKHSQAMVPYQHVQHQVAARPHQQQQQHLPQQPPPPAQYP
jgi:hypothetical protein